MSFRSFTGHERIALSPDASLVAFAVNDSAKWKPATHAKEFLSNGVPGHVAGSEIWISHIKKKESFVLTPDWGSSWGPRWRPDSGAIAFFSDRNGIPQIWIWDHASNEIALACKDPICVRFGFEGLHWLPNGRHIVVKLRAPGWNPPETESSEISRNRDVWVSPPENTPRLETEEGWRWFDRCRGDIAIIDVSTGQAIRVGTEIFPFGISVSPDGKYIAAMSFSGESAAPRGNILRYNLHLFGVDGSHKKIIAKDVVQAYGKMFAWSPDSSKIACISSESEYGTVHVFSIDGDSVSYEGQDDVRLDNPVGYQPLWSSDGKKIYCWTSRGVVRVDCENGEIRNVTDFLKGYGVIGMFHALGSDSASDFGYPNAIAIMARNGRMMQEGIFRIEEGQATPIVEASNRSFVRFFFQGDNHQNWLVGQIEDSVNPPDLFAIHVQSGEEKRLTHLNPMEGVEHPPGTVLIEYPGPENKKIRGAFFLPAGYQPGRKYPIIIEVYYGSRPAGKLNTWGTHTYGTWLTDCGYGVFLADMPGLENEPAKAITALAEAAADAVVNHGYADRDRLGVIGGSLGGYTVNCIVTHSDRFHVAVSIAGFSDLISFSLTGGSRWLAHDPLSFKHPAWEDPEYYLRNSPVMKVNLVTTPLLLLHGTADDAVPIQQAEEMYAGLLRLGKPASLVRYHGEVHSPLEWSEENKKDYRNRICDWFDRFLKKGSI